MGVLRIRTYPDRSLRIRAERVPRVTDEERQELNDMAATMYACQGVGLAATQVGVCKELIVIDIGDGLLKVVNPVITKKTGIETCEEGCLSVPETPITIKRAQEIQVEFTNADGKQAVLAASGLLARAFQHEIDHLHGKLIIDYLNPLKRFFLKKKKKITNL